MSVESVIYSALTANTNVSAIVSTRVYPMVAPRSAASDPVVIMIRREGERDIVEPLEAAEDKPLFRVSQDWAIEHA